MKKLMIGALAILSLNLLAQPSDINEDLMNYITNEYNSADFREDTFSGPIDEVASNLVGYTHYQKMEKAADLLEEMAKDPDYVQHETEWVQKLRDKSPDSSKETLSTWYHAMLNGIEAQPQNAEEKILALQSRVMKRCIARHWSLDGIKGINIMEECSDFANNIARQYRAAATVAEKVETAKNMPHEEAQEQLIELSLAEQTTDITQEEAQTILSEETQEQVQVAEQQEDQTL